MLSYSSHTGPRGTLRSMGDHEVGKIRGKVLGRMLHFVKPHTGKLAVATALMFVTSATTLAVPYVTKVIIDEYITPGTVSGLSLIGAGLVAIILVGYASQAGQQLLLSRIGLRVLNHLRNTVFRHLQRLGVAYNDTHIVGVTISRVTSDVEVINSLLSEGLVSMIGDLALLLGIVAIMIAMDVRLALISFAVVPLMITATALFTRKARDAYRLTREKIGAVIGDLAENIGGIRVTQAFSQEKETHEKFEGKNRENRDALVHAMSLSYLFLPSIDIISILATCIVLAAGGLFVIRGTVTIGVVVAFMTYVNRFFVPIRELSQIYTTLQSASAGSARVLELLDTEPLVKDRPGALPVRNIQGDIVFDNVSFHYLPQEPVLEGISFRIPPGTTAAFVGPTGAGKTTITNLISRFYETQEGQIRIDGQDIRDITIESLHANMGYVPQDPYLFPGTIADNIAFGNPDAHRDSIEAAASAAHIDTFVRRMPEGYDTRVSEGGTNLSVGQRQLICIARAILVNPKILIMDEATASVDSVTETIIQKALDTLLRDRTAIVVAHRLSTIKNAGIIYVIEHGRITESGTHYELFRHNGTYRDLYQKQYIVQTKTEESV